MNARASLQRLAREHALIDPDRETCRECSGSGRGDYGPCPDCDGIGSHPAETTHLHDPRSAEQWMADIRAAHDAVMFTGVLNNSGAASPRNAGEAASLPCWGGLTFQEGGVMDMPGLDQFLSQLSGIPPIPLITATINVERSEIIAAAYASDMSAAQFEALVVALYPEEEFQ